MHSPKRRQNNNTPSGTERGTGREREFRETEGALTKLVPQTLILAPAWPHRSWSACIPWPSLSLRFCGNRLQNWKHQHRKRALQEQGCGGRAGQGGVGFATCSPPSAGMGLAAEGKIVQQVELYKWRSTIWRLDVWPFLGAYVAWVLGVATRLDSTDAGIVLAALAILHILTFLFSAWSVDFRCFSQASKVRNTFLLKWKETGF